MLFRSLYLSPVAHSAFKNLQFQIRNQFTNVLLREGVFTNIGEKMTVYIRQRESSGELLGVLVQDETDPKKQVTMVAERGALVRGEDGPKVLMVNGNRQMVDRNRNQLSLLYFDRYTLDLGSAKSEDAPRFREAQERFIDELFSPGDSASDRNNAEIGRAHV